MASTDIDKNMLQAIETLETTGVIGMGSNFAESIGITRQEIYHIKQGMRSFTAKQIKEFCVIYGISPNFIFGFSDKMKLKKVASKKPKELPQMAREPHGKGGRPKGAPNKKLATETQTNAQTGSNEKA